MKVGAFSCDSKSEAKNMIKEFEKKYKLDMYEGLRPMFDLYEYTKDILQIDGTMEHMVTVEDYWANCQDEFKSHERTFSRLTMD